MENVNSFFQTFAHKESQRFKVKVGVFLFLIHDEKILLLRRACTGIDDGFFVVPMGCIDGNETATAACIREAYEEANITIKPEDLAVCHVMHRLHHMPEGFSFEQIDIFFKATQFQGTIANNEPHKCDLLDFFPLNELPEYMAEFIRTAIKNVQAHIFFSEYGWETSLHSKI